MSERIYDVEISIIKTVRVRVPDDPQITMGDDVEDVAEEFALGGTGSWSEYVISEESETNVEEIREVPASAPLALAGEV
jgi:hypothetical protein